MRSPPGLADQPGKPLSPLALDEILRSNVWNDFIFRDAEYYWQTSLLEPVGGMDNFVKAFARQSLTRQAGTIDGLIRYGAKVDRRSRWRADKVDDSFRGRGAERTLAADYCVSTIPMPIFKTLLTNLPAAYMNAARALPVQAAGKVGWQADRFWETRDQIYGGISWTTDVITQIWYPSSGYLGRKGVLTGAYMYGDGGRDASMPGRSPSACRSPRTRARSCTPTIAKLVEHGLAIGWNNMEFERFGWADESDPAFAAPAQSAGAAAGPLPHGGRPDHLLERLAGGRAAQRLGGGQVDRPPGAPDRDATRVGPTSTAL